MLLTIITLIQNAVADSVAKNKIDQNAQKFLEIDPWGIGITFIGMAVVFLSLLLLYILFYNITRILNRKKNKSVEIESVENPKKTDENLLTGEVNAAIATAIHLYFTEIHDKENTVLTINRVARIYSPWSSKIYGIRQFPR